MVKNRIITVGYTASFNILNTVLHFRNNNKKICISRRSLNKKRKYFGRKMFQAQRSELWLRTPKLKKTEAESDAAEAK